MIKKFAVRFLRFRFLASQMMCLLGILLFYPVGLLAQSIIGARPGLIHYTVGDVYVDGQAIQIASQQYPMLNEGQVVRTARGRAEILLAPEIFLRLGEWGTLRLIHSHPENAEVELLKGVALVEVVKMPRGSKIQIQCAKTRTELKSVGVYRFDVNSAVIHVYGGKVEVSSSGRKLEMGRGKAMNLAGTAYPVKFTPKDADPLYRWAAHRSFFLFTRNPEAMESQTHWRITASGWSKNKNFQISLFSPLVARVFAKKQLEERAANAKVQQTLDYLRAAEQARARQTQIQQQMEQQVPNR